LGEAKTSKMKKIKFYGGLEKFTIYDGFITIYYLKEKGKNRVRIEFKN